MSEELKSEYWNLCNPKPTFTQEDVEAAEVAVAEEYMLIPKGTPWEDLTHRLTKAALNAVGVVND